jgi:sec-independent protein translocase protein TatB
MFDIGWGELVLIGLVALIVIGPKELPTVLRTAGQWMGKIKRMASEFQGQFQEALREAEVADLKQQAEDISGSLKSITEYDPLAETAKEEAGADAWDEPFETPEHTEAAAEAAEAKPAVESATEPAAAKTTAEPEPAPAAPVAAVESAPIVREELAPAETPPPKQAGGTG